MAYNERLEKILTDTAVQPISGVSIDVHPDSLLATTAAVGANTNLRNPSIAEICVDGEGGPAEAGFAAARACLGSMYNGIGTMANAHVALLEPTKPTLKGERPRMEIPASRAAELDNLLVNSAARISGNVQRSVGVLDSSIAALDDRIAVSTRHPRPEQASVIQETAEVRDYIKTLPDGKRMSFLHQAVQNKDLMVVHSVVNARPWLSGLSPAEQDIIRSMAQESLAPRESRQAAALRQARDKVVTAGQSFGIKYNAMRPRLPDKSKQQALEALRKAG